MIDILAFALFRSGFGPQYGISRVKSSLNLGKIDQLMMRSIIGKG